MRHMITGAVMTKHVSQGWIHLMSSSADRVCSAEGCETLYHSTGRKIQYLIEDQRK